MNPKHQASTSMSIFNYLNRTFEKKRRYRKAQAYRRKQVVKVIWHKAASPPHTDGSDVFARLCQCAPHLVHHNRHRYSTGAAPCWITLSISTVGHIRHVLDWPLFALLSHVGIWTPSNTWRLGSTGVNIPKYITIGSAAFAGLTVVTDRPTDRPRYSVCSNMPHLACAVMRPKISQQNKTH